MNVLLTNIELTKVSGTVAYIRDLSLALHRRGFYVEVFTYEIGEVGLYLQDQGILVMTSLKHSKRIPDIIHAHHSPLLIDALIKYRNTPAIYFVHDRFNPLDKPIRDRNVLKYIAVDFFCKERFIEDIQLEEKYYEIILNWVDTEKFNLRSQIQEAPKKAAVFSNYASEQNYLNKIREACQRANVDLEIIGLKANAYEANPHQILHNYDLIFAKGKAAIEALATGASVIVSDTLGYGGLVTKENFGYFRKFNFGRKTLDRDFDVATILQDIKRYDREELKLLSVRIRSEASLHAFIDYIVPFYNTIILNFAQGIRGPKSAGYLLYYRWIAQHCIHMISLAIHCLLTNMLYLKRKMFK